VLLEDGRSVYLHIQTIDGNADTIRLLLESTP
jgi:hypothetical protein